MVSGFLGVHGAQNPGIKACYQECVQGKPVTLPCSHILGLRDVQGVRKACGLWS